MLILSLMAPLYLLVGLGAYLKYLGFPSENFWENVEKLTYYVLFPALIFSSLSRAELDIAFLHELLLIIVLPTLSLGALQILAMRFGTSAPTFTSMFQGTVRNNTTIGLVIIAMLMPENGVAMMALVMTVMVIINNFACVLVLENWGEHALANSDNNRRTRYTKLAKNLAKNPLILASIFGLLASALPIPLPAPLIDAISYLGETGLPMALLVIGAGLRFAALKSNAGAIITSTISKLVIMPIIVIWLCKMLGVSNEHYVIFVLYGALPTAMSAYVLASQMGGDKQSMARIITLQMLVSALTLPIVLHILQGVLP